MATTQLYHEGDLVTTKDGSIGIVVEVDMGYSIPMYLLSMDDGYGEGWAMETELQLAA